MGEDIQGILQAAHLPAYVSANGVRPRPASKGAGGGEGTAGKEDDLVLVGRAAVVLIGRVRAVLIPHDGSRVEEVGLPKFTVYFGGGGASSLSPALLRAMPPWSFVSQLPSLCQPFFARSL